MNHEEGVLTRFSIDDRPVKTCCVVRLAGTFKERLGRYLKK